MTIHARRTRSGLLAAALGLLLPALGGVDPAAADPPAPAAVVYETPTAFPMLASTYGLEWARVVRLGDGEILPRRVVIAEGQKLAWRNEAAIAQRIAFDKDVAKAMRCTEVVNFALTNERLESGMLHTGDVATLCELAPGTYRYAVERDDHSDRRGPLSERAHGEIVVRARAVGAR